MPEHTPKPRKRDTGEQGNRGEFATTTRPDADVAIDPLDPSIDWDHEDTGISWEYPTSDADSRFHEDGTIADRVLLDGTVEHHDADGTLTHVTLDDGSTVLINGDPDHSYVVHRRLAEFAYETHELTPVEAEARFAELSPALATHHPGNAARFARGIAERIAVDDLYEVEALCESAAQQHALTVWMQQHPRRHPPRPVPGQRPQSLDEARKMRDRLLQTFAERCQDESLPTGPSYIPVITIDHGRPTLSVDVRNVPDAVMRNRYDGNETISPIGRALRMRIEIASREAGAHLESVDLESDLQRGIRRLRTHSRRLHEQLDAA
ncbi:hypothetical protein [Brachybacterium atlanticum]|uniref:hypothetical protein n=1 Tax=Brachybacterium atlanticum TaxID=2911888 RepID=UPI0021DFA24C|nr:hypothetical protein [Brachybacterium atlanticum]